MSNKEIDLHINNWLLMKLLQNQPLNSKNCNTLKKLQNKKIAKLYKQKSEVQTQIHRNCKKKDPLSKLLVIKLKEKMKKIKNDLYLEFCKSSKENWADLIKSINYRDSASFFPTLNKIFRKKNKNSMEIESIAIKESELEILESCKINTDHLEKIDNLYKIDDSDTLPDIIGSFFGKINTKEEYWF